MNKSRNSPPWMMPLPTLLYQPGSHVRVTQQIVHRAHVYSIVLAGRILRQERQESGSWFARNKADRLWLDRLIVEKEDGEKIVLNLDEFTHVDVLSGPPPVEGVPPLVTADQDRAASLT